MPLDHKWGKGELAESLESEKRKYALSRNFPVTEEIDDDAAE